MRAAGQHAPGESKVLSPRFPALAIPRTRVALFGTLSLSFFLLGNVPMWFKATRAIEQRDEVITLLARSDPAATDRLFSVYATYYKLADNVG